MAKTLKTQKRGFKKNQKNEESFSRSNNSFRILKTKDNSSKISKSWTKEEDRLLTDLINFQKIKNFSEISKKIPNHSSTQCRMRWNKIKSGLKKGQWSLHEDKLLKEWIKENGPRKWEQCGQFILGRSGKQCREHWNNCLNPNLIKGDWTSEEDFLIMYFYEKCNGSWKKIILLFNGRTENSIKNRFFSQLRKIATKDMNISERKFCAKIKLEELKKFLGVAISEAKNEFLNDNPMTEEELNIYLNKMELKIKKTINESNDSNLSTNLGDSENISKIDSKSESFIGKRKRTSDETLLDNSDDFFKFKIENETQLNFDFTDKNGENNETNEDKNYYISSDIFSTKVNVETNNYNININNNDINNSENDLKNSFFKSLNYNPINLLEDLDNEYKSSYEFSDIENFSMEKNEIRNFLNPNHDGNILDNNYEDNYFSN